jgi:hypothetical protein
LLVIAPERWPALELARVTPVTRSFSEEVTDDHARLWIAGGGHAVVDRARCRAELGIPEDTTADAIAHPYLAPVALVMSRWLGREGFHGGAIVAGGGVWGVLGDKTAGKSTTLAYLAREGVDVFTDDVLIIEDGTAYAGPRSIDLREGAAQQLGIGTLIGRVGERDRWRVRLDPVAPELPLRGWVTLEWGEKVAVEPIRGAARLHALLPHRGVFLTPAKPAVLVELTGLPHLRLTRPRDWDSLPEAADRLLDAVSG